METTNIEKLRQRSVRRIRDTGISFKRYLHRRIDWADRLIIIKGARGVGKTTLLLQYIKEHFNLSEEALFASLDDLWFTDHLLTDLAEQFYSLGGKYLFLDEVHKYPNWSQEVKNIYDNFPDLRLVLTSSSALHIYSGKGDLSRRGVVYEMQELSLREYVALKSGQILPSFTLREVVENHVELSANLSAKIKPVKLLKEYYRIGNYPYFIENPDNYHHRLQNTVNTIIEADLPAVLNIDYSSVQKLKKLLYVLSTSTPFKPNISKLSQRVGTARGTLLRYIHHLSEAHLIQLLHSGKEGMSYLAKPDKIYLHNPNLIETFGEQKTKVGTFRETFFLNQVGNAEQMYAHGSADFLVNNNFVFEIGGKNKGYKQIKGLSDAYIVSDDIEIGSRNRIPLWLFGFLY
jgi:predicted AAA+ superfamily ATPase